MEENLPSTVATNFPDPNNLAEFFLTISVFAHYSVLFSFDLFSF